MPTFTKRIDANIRDVGYSDTSPSESSATSMGNPGAVVRQIALRFVGVNIDQGATITSAKITFTASTDRASQSINMKIHGVDEDDTAEFVISPEDTARTRTHTTANVDWDETITTTTDVEFDSADITNIVQEIVDRVGWSSGNAMGFWIADDGTSSGNYVDSTDYNSTNSEAALLTIVYEAATTTSTTTTSTSTSTSTTTTLPYVYPEDTGTGLKVSREDFDAKSNNPDHYLLHSKYPQLQVYDSGQFTVTTSSSTIKEVYHGLNYKPFCLGFMQGFKPDFGEETGNVTDEFYQLDWSTTGASYEHNSELRIGKEKITFFMSDTFFDKLITISGYYIIFRNPIDEVLR